jgi:hypothetical protein
MPTAKRVAVAVIAAFGLLTIGSAVASASGDDAKGEFSVAATMVEYTVDASMTEY